MFYLLFYKQILHLKLLFGQNSQKRKNTLSSMVVGYYQNLPVFNWKQLYFQYFSFFQFFNSWFQRIKNYTHFYKLHSFVNNKNFIKKNLYLNFLIKKKFHQQLIFFDLRLDFFFLIKDLTDNLNQLFIPLWFPGLLSNFNGQSLMVKENFFHITKILPWDFSSKLLIFFELNHLTDMLSEVFSLFSYTQLKIITFNDAIQPLNFQENCLLNLSANTSSFNSLYFYCSLFFYLFKGFISYLENLYSWLQYYTFIDDDEIEEIMPRFSRILKYNFFKTIFLTPYRLFYSSLEKNTQKRLPMIEIKLKRWSKLTYRIQQNIVNKFFFQWKQFKSRLKWKRKQRFFSSYDAFFFNCKRWYTPSEYYYRRIRSGLIVMKHRRKCLYWHHILNNLSLKNWFSNYSKVLNWADNTANVNPLILKPYSIYLHSFANYKFKTYFEYHKKKLRNFWKRRICLLWWRFIFIDKYKSIDMHLVLAVYLLKTFGPKFSHYDWIDLSTLDLTSLKSFNEKFIPKTWNLPFKNLGIYVPFLMKEYLRNTDISARQIKNKSLRHHILLGQNKRKNWKKKQKKLKYKKIWKKK